jgi:RNA polymerase sigma-70 factor (ECF subfamily)
MESPDRAVVASVLAGDREAFRVLVERYSTMIFSLAFRITGNREDADDVVQETFLRAYRALGRFQSQSTFATWLYRIATNAALDLLDRRRTQPQPAPVYEDEDPPEATLESHYADPEREVLGGELKRRVDAAMKTLTPTERTAFVLRHFEEKSIDEIAAAMNVRAGTAKQSIFRAVAKVRRALEPAMRSAR